MTPPTTPAKPIHRRLLGPLLARLGFHDFRMLYGQVDLALPRPDVQTRLPFDVAEGVEGDLTEVLAAVPEAQRLACGYAHGFGSTLVVARHERRLAGYSWVHDSLLSVLHLSLGPLPPDVSYTFASYVLPEFRGQRLFQRLTLAVHDHARAVGKHYVGNLVERGNAASIAARDRLGATFQPVRIVKLPGLPARFVGTPPRMGS